MSALTEFLLARIAEDDEAAQAALPDDPADEPYSFWGFDGELAGRFETGHHALRWSPRRALAECEAKRKIVGDPEHRGGVMYDYFLLLLAAVYSDHPDYQPGWRP